jgi:hypothetical protein
MSRPRNVGAATALLLVALSVAAGPRTSRPSSTSELKTLGKAYAPVLASTYADAWRVAAETLENGGTVAQAQKVLQDEWNAGRARAFKTQVIPALAQILPEGTEPADAAARARVVAAWRDFAAGLKSAH